MHESLAWRVDEIESLSADDCQALRVLWTRDPHASPFAAPAFLAFLTDAARAAGERVLLARAHDADGAPAALWPLRLDRRGELGLLQELQGDHCTCVARDSVSPAALADGLAQVIARADVRSVALRRVPPWGPTLAAARAAVNARGLGHRAFAATPCPVLAVAPGDGAGARMAAAIEGHRRVRNYENRLRKQPGYAFEALEDATDLERWVDEFATAHERRWNPTATPSQFRLATRRAHLLRALAAGHADGTLVRFALRLDEQRLGLVAALRGADRLVYHLVVTSPEAETWRAGHVLIRAIGLWMAERSIACLDFGEGAEAYKLRYANGDERLWRVLAWRQPLSRAALIGRLDEAMRRTPERQEALDLWVNRRLRGDGGAALRRGAAQLRSVRRFASELGRGSALPRLVARFGTRREIVYLAHGGGGAADAAVVELDPLQALALLEAEQDLSPATRVLYLEEAQRGGRAFGIREEGRAVHVSWLKRWDGVALPEWLLPATAAPWSIVSAATARDRRGRGCFARTLAAILAGLPAGAPVLIYTDAWNRPAQRAIERAGFRACAEIETPRGGSATLRPRHG